MHKEQRIVIKIENIVKHFGYIKAVDGVSLNVRKGEIFGFLGPNGAGKSTTIRCMMDYIRPDSGSIQILGADSRDFSAGLKVKIGYLPGEVKLYNNWTGKEHIQLIKSVRGGDTSEIELCKRFKFDPSKRVKNLSTGNKQKLGIVLAFMHNPEILILDEPTTGLDPLLQNEFYKLIRERAERGATIFMSSHNLAEVEKVCNRVAIIRKGVIVETESISSLLDKRIYTVELRFDGEHSNFIKDLPEEAEIISQQNGNITLQIRGNIGSLLSKIPTNNLEDIKISHATLEDLFIEYYLDD